jgi:hypothetical protein
VSDDAAWRGSRAGRSATVLNLYNVPEPPVLMHWDNDFTRAVGPPAAYDFGPERVGWLADVLSDPIGDEGKNRRLNVQIRCRNVIGEVLWSRDQVTGARTVDSRGTGDCFVDRETVDGVVSLNGEARIGPPVE